MTAPGPVTPEVPFEPSQPPVIEGLNPTVYSTPESFEEKFLPKTREPSGTHRLPGHGGCPNLWGQSPGSQLMTHTQITAQGFRVATILLGLAASAMRSGS
uniref:Uncharacterized protein n=1 Tax=Panthera leo TaxID=9689 RepID=A0A8C8XEL2_PANLE